MQTGSRRLAGASVILGLSFAVLTLTSFQPANGDSCDVSFCLTSTGPPVYIQLGAYNSMEIGYKNLSQVNLTSIVYLVVRNTSGQTVLYSTEVLELSPGANGTAYLVAFGLPPGYYNAALFAISTAGTAVSSATLVSFTNAS